MYPGNQGTHDKLNQIQLSSKTQCVRVSVSFPFYESYQLLFFFQFEVPFPGTTITIFISFLIVMAIVLINLLVGLAVNDIKKVQENAELKKLATQVQEVLCYK